MFRMFLKGVTQDWKKRGNKINLTQFKVLYILDNDGPQKVSQLAHALSISSAAVTGITDQLLTEGYVTKERCEQDRRVVFITLTDKGRTTVKEINNFQEVSLLSYFEMLEDDDVHHLKRILGKLLTKRNTKSI